METVDRDSAENVAPPEDDARTDATELERLARPAPLANPRRTRR